MSNPRLEVSVVICAYTEERWDDLVAAVESVRRQTAPAREIIVVIDHNPALLERARAEISGVKVIENREARGLSGARNSGIAAAGGAIIAFLDDDAMAAPDWIEQLLAGYSRPEVLGVGGAIEPLWENGRPAWFPEEFDWVVGCTYRGMPERAAPVRNLIGANMSFRREVFETLAGFRNGMGRVGVLPVGCEETELCIRIRQRWPDRALLFRPAAKVAHRVPAGRASRGYFRSRCYSEGRSKALVARLVGAGDGLASERSYTLRVLPGGALRGVRATLQNRATGGLAMAGAIISGLGWTVAGYVAGSISRHTARMQDGEDRPLVIDEGACSTSG